MIELKPTCETCKFSADQYSRYPYALCRRHAPTTTKATEYRAVESPIWPKVHYSDWCGDWEAALSSKGDES